MTADERMKVDLYRASFARLGRWPAHDPNLRIMGAAERRDREEEREAIRRNYARDAAAQREGRICACDGPHRAGCTAV